MNEPQVHLWKASDGIELAYHELGAGRPVVLLHGLFSDAVMNWIKFGHAARIAEDGFRVIMPDLRAHGLSGRPHGPEYYPPGVLARDLRELIAHLGLDDFDLGGFRSARGRRSRVSAKACDHAEPSSVAQGSRACAIGNGASISFSRRSKGSIGSRAATRIGCRFSS